MNVQVSSKCLCLSALFLISHFIGFLFITFNDETTFVNIIEKQTNAVKRTDYKTYEQKGKEFNQSSKSNFPDSMSSKVDWSQPDLGMYDDIFERNENREKLTLKSMQYPRRLSHEKREFKPFYYHGVYLFHNICIVDIQGVEAKVYSKGKLSVDIFYPVNTL